MRISRLEEWDGLNISLLFLICLASWAHAYMGIQQLFVNGLEGYVPWKKILYKWTILALDRVFII